MGNRVPYLNLSRFLSPKPTISDQEVTTGLRWLTREGMASMGFNSITTSGILAAFALVLGANNFQIGILAAIPFITQPLQIPAILLVERLRRRKAIAVFSWLLAQLLWFPIALIPIFAGVPSGRAISLLLGLMTVRGLLTAITNCGWNSWIRDLVPQQVLGRFFSRRLALATSVGVVFGLGAAFFLDYWRGHVPSENAVFGYTYVLLFGALFLGLASPLFMSLMPEPLMQLVPGPRPSLRQTLTTPLRDRNFRRLIQFLLFWGFASNLAIPFFAVYMLQRLGLSLSLVIALSVLSQLTNIMFLHVWGALADRFGNKVILSLCASLYLLIILGWTFTTMPERYFLTMPLLAILHIFAGIAAAGVTLTVGTIGLKLAPQGQATPYLAGASLATSMGAGLGPLLGGLLADHFSLRQLNLTFTWIDPVRSIQLPALSIIGLDFLFGIAFILGLMALSFLTIIREEGEAGREVVLQSLLAPMRQFSRPMSSVSGLGFLGNFPYGYLKRAPVPGLDVALGVTAYQIADMARIATLATIRGRKVTKKLAKELKSSLAIAWKAKEEMQLYGIEVARQAARGAIHATNEKPLDLEQLARPVMVGVVQASSEAGVAPQDAILGASQGIIHGAAETGADLGVAAAQAVTAAREVAAQTRLPEELAAAKAAEGALQAAETIGPEAVAKVRESLPQEIASDIKGPEGNG
jgi:MFS family permease